MSSIKEALYRELEVKAIACIDGVSFDPHIFQHLDLGGRYQEEVHSLFELDHESHVGFKFPSGFYSPSSLSDLKHTITF